MQVTDKRVLVTGAFGLIGLAASKAFLRGGAKVMVAGHRVEQIEPIRAELGAEFDEDRFVVCAMDIVSEQSVSSAVTRLDRDLGGVDVLVNNAAIDAKYDGSADSLDCSSFEEYPFELIQRSIDVNVAGTIRVTQHVCRRMLQQGWGNIVNVGSVYSLVAPNPALYTDPDSGARRYKPVAYVATKAFIPNFTRYLATCYADRGIRCNAVAPHGIFNDHDGAFLKSFEALSPMGRMCELGEAVTPILFLASDASSYINGHVLVVDGGWTAQ